MKHEISAPQTTLADFAKRGYLPREIPHTFSTETLSSALMRRPQFAEKLADTAKGNHGHLCIFNLARAGNIKRRLGIPQPSHFVSTAREIITHWEVLHQHFSASKLGLSRPLRIPGERAFTPAVARDAVADERIKQRSSARYVVCADIARFYPSIYTHTIPWALHTKFTAKSCREPKDLLGNMLDLCVRRAQDLQTVSLPIGPDTSWVVSEVILCAIDKELDRRGFGGAIRWVDDFEIAVESEAKAHDALLALDETLVGYELALNERKTQILKLPARFEEPEFHELRSLLPYGGGHEPKKSALQHYFNRMLDMAHRRPDLAIVKYGVSALRGIEIEAQDWLLFLDLLLQCVAASPEVLPSFLQVVLKQVESGHALDASKLSSALSRIVIDSSRHRLSSEVSWALWTAMALKIELHSECCSAVVGLGDDVSMLILLDAAHSGRIASTSVLDDFRRSAATRDSLIGQHWLLTYEGLRHGWLETANQENIIASSEQFTTLHKEGVGFYDVGAKDKVSYEWLTQKDHHYDEVSGLPTAGPRP